MSAAGVLLLGACALAGGLAAAAAIRAICKIPYNERSKICHQCKRRKGENLLEKVRGIGNLCWKCFHGRRRRISV